MEPLLATLRDHIHSAQTTPFEADWPDLLAFAKRHDVSGIVYSQCKDFVPQPFADDLSRSYGATVYFYARRKNVMETIETSLADIPHFMIKGASVAQYYPVPALRTMGDTDIVVHTEDRNEADRRLQGLGLNNVSKHQDREWQYYYARMEFELHDHMVYPEAVNVDAQERYFNDFWKHVQGNELDWDFHFLFLIFHMRKHFMNSGIGFRQFLDIAVLTSRGPELDWEWIKGELEKLGMWAFAERVFALNDHWFGVVPPIAVSSFPDSFLLSSTELILKNGVFGFDNEENRANAAVNAVRREGHARTAMLRRAVRGLLPGYEAMQSVPHYSYVKGKPYLIPVAWIHRGIRSIAKRRVGKNLKAVMAASFADEGTIQRREVIYKQWGL